MALVVQPRFCRFQYKDSSTSLLLDAVFPFSKIHHRYALDEGLSTSIVKGSDSLRLSRKKVAVNFLDPPKNTRLLQRTYKIRPGIRVRSYITILSTEK